MTETTQFFNPRARGRHIAARFDWVARKGFSARVGATLLRFKPAGTQTMRGDRIIQTQLADGAGVRHVG